MNIKINQAIKNRRNDRDCFESQEGRDSIGPTTKEIKNLKAYKGMMKAIIPKQRFDDLPYAYRVSKSRVKKNMSFKKSYISIEK